MGFVYFLLFILFLSILIVVHELGHFSAAKFFKVYCAEFSIGFGPAIIHHRKQGRETYFSLRCIPFGGYVAMYGEGGTKPEGAEDVPEERSLAKQKKWKQAIILIAGVTMNVILAIVFFFISEQACPHYAFTINYANYTNNSPILSAIVDSGLDPNQPLYLRGVADKDNKNTVYIYLDGAHPVDQSKQEKKYDPATVTFKNGEVEKEVTVCLNQSSFSLNKLSYNDALVLFKNYEKEKTDSDGQKVKWMYPDVSSKINLDNVASITFHVSTTTYTVVDGKLNASDKDRQITRPITVNVKNGKVDDLGASMYKEKYWNNYQPHTDKNGIVDDRNALRKTFVDFGNSSTLIFRGLGSLFTEGFKNVGGIVAVGVQTTNTLTNFGFSAFLSMWAMISVNLAVVNLIPIPGLDGWHLLVLAIEGITKKKLPEKFKTIASLIGLALVFILMILIIIKDIITLV